MANVYTLWMRPKSGELHSMLLSTLQILVCFQLLPNSCARVESMIWNTACLGLVSAETQMWPFYLGQHIYGQVYTGRLHSMPLSTKQILVYFQLLPNSCARVQSMIWNAACLGLVSAEAQMWPFYLGQHIYGQCIYAVNEAKFWQTAQHAAFDLANSSLLSATSQQLC